MITDLNKWRKIYEEHLGNPKNKVELVDTFIDQDTTLDNLDVSETDSAKDIKHKLKRKGLNTKNINEENEISNDFKNWKKALKLYRTANTTEKQEKSFERLFSGSRITAKFIYRSITYNEQTIKNYMKDCEIFGKDELDDLVDNVLYIMAN